MDPILEQINSAGLRFVEFALPMFVQSGVLILILLLTDFALRKKVRAGFRYWIWLLVLLKLVLPTSLSTPLSLGYFFGDQLAYMDIAHTTAETVQTAPTIVSPMKDPSRIEAGSDTSAIAPTMPTIEPVVTGPLSPSIVPVAPLSWQGAVFLAWLTVVITMGLLLLQRAIFVRGLVALHHMMGAFQNWPEYRKITGSKYFLKATEENRASTYKHDIDMNMRIADTSHPITRGMSDFQIHDEGYKYCSFEKNNRVLLTTDHPDSDKTIAWTRKYGKAKVCTIQLGHDSAAFQNPNYRRLIARAIRWSAGTLN